MKEKFKEAFSIHNDTADYIEIKDRIVSGGQVTGTNLCILMMAILIASAGLNMNSTAVIIGAMLISPLMGTIQAMGYGAAASDAEQFKKSGIGFLFQVAVSLLTSTLYFWISPISTQTSELLARTQPNIWDVLIAVCGGIAGMIGTTRKEKSNVIPGVAIATALMPPLCTCGYGIAHHSLKIALGAGYLFLVNSYFIFLCSALILIVLKIPQKGSFSDKQKKRLKRRMIFHTVLILIPCVIVAGFMVQQANQDSSSVTGFDTVVPVQRTEQEIKVLFPETDRIKIGTMEYADENGDMVAETDIIVYLNEELSKTETGRMECWLKELYGDSISVLYITKAPD